MSDEHPTLYRVISRPRLGGMLDWGDPMPLDLAKIWVKYGNSTFPDIEHWLITDDELAAMLPDSHDDWIVTNYLEHKPQPNPLDRRAVDF